MYIPSHCIKYYIYKVGQHVGLQHARSRGHFTGIILSAGCLGRSIIASFS